MTEVANFILRWVCLKRTSDAGHKAGPSGDKPFEPAETVVAVAEAAPTPSQIGAAADEPFDRSSLPPIEAIGADTDVRGFLQCGVPAELTRAALRRAWTCDPAIRDFVGIAENQWDFNDPYAMPGFGPLLAAEENVPAIVTQAPGMRNELAEIILDMPASMKRSVPPAVGHERADPGQNDLHPFNGLPSINDSLRGFPDDGSGEARVTKNDRVGDGDSLPRNQRSRGSAIPR
jgi:uncharacterized protein DUF3306